MVTAEQDYLQPQTFCKPYRQKLKCSPVEDGNWENEDTGLNYKCHQPLHDNKFF